MSTPLNGRNPNNYMQQGNQRFDIVNARAQDARTDEQIAQEEASRKPSWLQRLFKRKPPLPYQ